MRTPFSVWSRYVNRLFGASRAITLIRRDDRRLRRRASWHVCAAAEVLEQRALLSGFAFADFSSVAGLNLVGTAAAATDSGNSQVLRLTPAVDRSTGGAWFSDKQIVAGNFQTTFQFQLATGSGGADGSDGFAFIIQNTGPTELRGPGGKLGYD